MPLAPLLLRSSVATQSVPQHSHVSPGGQDCLPWRMAVLPFEFQIYWRFLPFCLIVFSSFPLQIYKCSFHLCLTIVQKSSHTLFNSQPPGMRPILIYPLYRRGTEDKRASNLRTPPSWRWSPSWSPSSRQARARAMWFCHSKIMVGGSTPARGA